MPINRVVWEFRPTELQALPGDETAVLTQHIDGKAFALAFAIDFGGYFSDSSQVDTIRTKGANGAGPWLLSVSDGHFPSDWKSSGLFASWPAERYYPVEVAFEQTQSNVEVSQGAEVFLPGAPTGVRTVISVERGVFRDDGEPVFAVAANGHVIAGGPRPVVHITESQFVEAGFGGAGTKPVDVRINYYTHPFPWDPRRATVVYGDNGNKMFEIGVWNHRTGKYVPVDVNPDNYLDCAGLMKPGAGNNIDPWKVGETGVLALSESFLRRNGLWPPAPNAATADPKTPAVQGTVID